MRRWIAASLMALTLVTSVVRPAEAITCPGGLCGFVGSDSGSSLTGEGYFELVAHGLGVVVKNQSVEVRGYTLVAFVEYNSVASGFLIGAGSIDVYDSTTSILLFQLDVDAVGVFANVDSPTVPHDAAWTFAEAEPLGPDVVAGTWTPVGGGAYRGEIAYAGASIT